MTDAEGSYESTCVFIFPLSDRQASGRREKLKKGAGNPFPP